MTRSPVFQPRTASPTIAISPANSPPARAGLAASFPARSAAPRISSPRLVPAARTATTTWPVAGVGTGASRSSNTAPVGPGTANHAFIVCVMAITLPGRSARPSPTFELQILVRREVRVSGDRRHLGQPRPHAAEKRWLHDGREHRALVHELLDLLQQGLAPLLVHLGHLVAEEAVDVGIPAIGAVSPGDHEGLDPGRGIARRPAAHANQVLELLVLIGLVEGGP